MTNQDETQLTQALADFQPTPSRRFRERMNAAPWMQIESTAPTFAERVRTAFLRPALSTALALALVVAVVAVTPPLRAFAQELLGLFTRDSDDVFTVEEREQMEQEAMSAPGEWVSIEPYVDALNEMEAALETDVWVPGFLLPGYRFERAGYDGVNKVSSLTYLNQGNSSIDLDALNQPSFMLVQQPVDYYGTYSQNTVGASAEIEDVQVGDVQGQLVEGSWCSKNVTMNNPDPPVEWCSDNFVRMLIWQQDDYVFSIHALGDSDEPESLSKQEMIGTARNLTPDYVPIWEREQ